MAHATLDGPHPFSHGQHELVSVGRETTGGEGTGDVRGERGGAGGSFLEL